MNKRILWGVSLTPTTKMPLLHRTIYTGYRAETYAKLVTPDFQFHVHYDINGRCVNYRDVLRARNDWYCRTDPLHVARLFAYDRNGCIVCVVIAVKSHWDALLFTWVMSDFIKCARAFVRRRKLQRIRLILSKSHNAVIRQADCHGVREIIASFLQRRN